MMNRRPTLAALAIAVICPAAPAAEIPLNDLSRLVLKNVRAEVTAYHGTPALKLTEKEMGTGETLAVIDHLRFHDGALDVDVSGTPPKTAPGQARGFIGVVFRLQADGSHFENIYIRPTNGRADEQLRRNHSTQYVSAPDWPWERLRKESPGVYESYADMVPGEWTHMRIVVQKTRAALFIGGATQPCLMVSDLKLGDVEGSVALWIGPGTEGYFRNLTVSPQ